MKLFEHADFEQSIIRAADHFRSRGLREAIIEKDYFVTEALRVIEQVAGDKVIFKGGTSLSKGWNLIQYFSEDIDIFLDPHAFQPPLGKKAIDRELKKLRDFIAQHPGLTFVGKMFAIHAKVEAFKQAGKEIGTYARHYYDLFCLAERPEVLAMLNSEEYGSIRTDYDRVSREHFPKSYIPPANLSFANSDALFPTAKLRAAIANGFETQCRVLCFGPFPTWDQVQSRLEGVRELL